MTQPAKPSAAIGAGAEDLIALADRANHGDRAALPKLRERIAEPMFAEAFVAAYGGDLADCAQRALVGKLTGKRLAFREALLTKMALLRRELAGPSPSAVERLLVERAVACWLHVAYIETNYVGRTEMTLKLADHYERCLDRSQQRYLSALKALATVRRLAAPVLQVNIANRQTNVATPAVVVAE